MPIKFTADEESQIFKQAMAFWDKSSDMMSPLFSQVNDYERAWRVQLPKDMQTYYENKEDRAALAPPDFYINIKSLRAAIRTIIFGSKPYGRLSIEGQPNLRNEIIVKAENVLQALLDIQSDGRGFECEADKAIHQALYGGISAAFTSWHNKKANAPLRDADSGLIQTINDHPLMVEKTVASYPQSQAVDIRRMRIDPAADRREDIRIVGYHHIARLSDILKERRSSNPWYNFTEDEIIRSAFPREKYYEYISGEADKYTEKGSDEGDFSDKNVEVLDIRGLFRFQRQNGSMDFLDLVVHIGNRKVLLGAKLNDLPIHGWDLFDFPSIDQETGRLFTMGVVEPLLDEWVELFMKRNQSLDQSSRHTYDIFFGDKTACSDLPDRLEANPDSIYLIDVIGSGAQKIEDVISPVKRQTTGQDGFLQAATLSQELQRGMGINDYVQGLNPQRRETATAVSELVTGSRSLVEQIVKNLKDTYFAPAWRKHLVLWDFFMGHKENTIYDNRGQSFTVRPGELANFYTVDIDVATALDRPALQRRMVEAFPVIKDDPFYDPYEVRQAFNEVLKLPNQDRILIPNEHLMIIINRENMAMAAGVWQSVSPYDNHVEHQKQHLNFLSQITDPVTGMVDTNNVELSDLVPALFNQHNAIHQEYIDRMKQGIGNTKEMGGNAGNYSKPDQAAFKSPGIPKEGRE